MWPIVTDGIVWSVCLSVSLSVTIMSPAKTAELIEAPFGLWTQMGPRNHVLDEGPDPPWNGAVLGGKGEQPIVKYWDALRELCKNG